MECVVASGHWLTVFLNTQQSPELHATLHYRRGVRWIKSRGASDYPVTAMIGPNTMRKSFRLSEGAYRLETTPSR